MKQNSLRKNSFAVRWLALAAGGSLLLAGACSDDNDNIVAGTNTSTSSGSGGGMVTNTTPGGCPSKLSDCDGSCVDTQFDPDHCGACDESCAAPLVCSEGSCGLTCEGGTTKCGDKCADTDLDPQHCGKCNNACDAGQVCVDGACVLQCGGTTSPCGDKCVDLTADAANCGSCDNVCIGSDYCAGGVCCSSNEVNCGGACVDLQSDAAHCSVCDNACASGDLCKAGACVAPASCADVLTADPNAADGPHVLDPDGTGMGDPPFTVYCDMKYDGGGWTLISRYSNNPVKDKNWMQNCGAWWLTKTSDAGTVTSPTNDDDMISSAFWKVQAKELRITRTDNAPDHSYTLMTTNNCLGGQNFRAFLTSFGNYEQCAGPWAENNVKYSCDTLLGKDHATTLGFAGTQAANCTNPEIGGLNKISFWADWEGDGSVIMIGGGGSNCMRSDHGIGVTEEADAHFGGSDYDKGDFGDNGKTPPDPKYSLNLWVR